MWRLKAPLKVKVFVWLLLKRRLLTMNNLMKRWWTGDRTCVLCLSEPETGDHLFASCEFTKAILKGNILNKRALNICTLTWNIWEASYAKSGGLCRRDVTFIISGCWTLWKERNRRIFEKNKLLPSTLSADIRRCCSLWLEHC